MITYPLNNIDYTAEDAELFHCTRNSGIYSGDDFNFSNSGTDNTIKVHEGIAWIRNSRFSGKVCANKSIVTLDFGIADPSFPRIDVAAIRFDASKNSTELVVKNGIAKTDPSRPDITQTENVYELYIFEVYRKAGATTIGISDVKDLRLDPSLCGLMADSVTKVDTTAINNRIDKLIDDLRNEIEAVRDESAFLLKIGGEMSGPINMNKNKIYNVPDAISEDEAANLKTVINEISEKAAPSGYGLGETAKWSADANQETKNGYFYTTSSTQNTNIVHGAGHVRTYAATEVVQNIFRTNTGVEKVRYTTDGTTWIEEYVNPPMNEGIEFRTTERYLGKPVYKIVLNLGALPSEGSASAQLPSSPVDIVELSAYAIATGTVDPLPVFNPSTGAIKAILRKTGSFTVGIRVFEDMSAYSAYAVVKYTKE